VSISKLPNSNEFKQFSFTQSTLSFVNYFKANAAAFGAFLIDLCAAATASKEDYLLAAIVEPAFNISFNIYFNLHLLEFTGCFGILNLDLIDFIGNLQRRDLINLKIICQAKKLYYLSLPIATAVGTAVEYFPESSMLN
jgi:hypothetical protein